MEEKQRAHIKNHIKDLIELTDYKTLVNECVRVNLLTPEMRSILETPHDSGLNENRQYIVHEKLFRKLTHRGPDAYVELQNVLSTLNYVEALQLLKQQHIDIDNNYLSLSACKSKSNEQAMRDGGSYSKSNDKVDQSSKPMLIKSAMPTTAHKVVKSTQIHNDEKLGTYAMRSKDRGVLFVVNIINYKNHTNEPRNGAEEDSRALIHLFTEFGFKVFYEVDITEKQFFTKLDALLKSEDTLKTECFVLALMTHGAWDDDTEACVEFTDGSIVKEYTIRERFSNINCPNLVNKPKVLLLPYCRGSRIDRGSNARIQTDGLRHEKPIRVLSPTRADILICYATVIGFKTHRDPDKGSWYIQKFYEVMAQHAHNTDFETIVKKVQSETNKLRTQDYAQQMGSYLNEGFNKKLFFNPGYCGE